MANHTIDCDVCGEDLRVYDHTHPEEERTESLSAKSPGDEVPASRRDDEVQRQKTSRMWFTDEAGVDTDIDRVARGDYALDEIDRLANDLSYLTYAERVVVDAKLELILERRREDALRSERELSRLRTSLPSNSVTESPSEQFEKVVADAFVTGMGALKVEHVKSEDIDPRYSADYETEDAAPQKSVDDSAEETAAWIDAWFESDESEVVRARRFGVFVSEYTDDDVTLYAYKLDDKLYIDDRPPRDNMNDTWLDFGEALDRLVLGDKVARYGWNGKGQWIQIQWETHSGSQNMVQPFIFIHPVDGKRVPWVASQTDLLARDWYVVLEDEE